MLKSGSLHTQPPIHPSLISRHQTCLGERRTVNAPLHCTQRGFQISCCRQRNKKFRHPAVARAAGRSLASTFRRTSSRCQPSRIAAGTNTNAKVSSGLIINFSRKWFTLQDGKARAAGPRLDDLGVAAVVAAIRKSCLGA